MKQKYFFAIITPFLLTISVQAASLQGLSALGESVWPADAATVGRGMAGSALTNEGYSFVNPARTAFETKTRFFAAVEYQGVYTTQGSESIGRDRFDLSTIGLSIPMGQWGALGVGYSQRFVQSFHAEMTNADGNKVIVDQAGSLYEMQPTYAVRLPATLRFISLGAAWHFPMGRSTNTLKTSLDSSSLDSHNQEILKNIVVQDQLTGKWGVEDQGYPSFSIQMHRKSTDFFVSAARSYTLTRTLSQAAQISAVDTVGASEWQQSFDFPWQFGTGFSIRPTKLQSISMDFFQSRLNGSAQTGLDWAGMPATFRFSSAERILALGWQKDGTGLFFDSFVQRNTFRAGAWARSWYLEKVTEFAGALGYGTPLGKRGAELDLGVYGGIRTFETPETGREAFWGIKLGFTGIGAWGESSRRR